MNRPLRGFRADEAPGDAIWASAGMQERKTWRETLPPGPERERAPSEILRGLEARAGSDVEATVDEIRRLVGSHEPIELLSSVSSRAMSRFFTRGSSYDDPPETASWPAKLEYLVGLALSLPPGSGSTPTEVTDRLCELVGDVFDVVRARQMVASVQEPEETGRELALMRLLLREEHLLDRMPGYAVHLERIDSEVFGRHRAFYRHELGFSPADVITVVRRWIAEQNARLNRAVKDLRLHLRKDRDRATTALKQMSDAMTEAMSWNPEAVATVAGLDAAEVQAMLAFFSQRWESQPDFRLPGQHNLARLYPAVDLATGTYFVADVWALPGALHERLNTLAGQEPQMHRYLKHRAAAHERLAAEAMRAVFPPPAVWAQQHYTSASGPGEVDVLVALNWPLVLEAKSHSLTPPGRRGAPDRLRKKTLEVVGEGASQAQRTWAYIRDEHGRSFAGAAASAPVDVLPADVSGITQIIVTFERMDPVAYLGPAHTGRAKQPLWVVSIADLLMAAELLNTPAAFHHYARVRSSLAAAGLAIFMESDAVGAYLEDRLAAVSLQLQSDPDVTVMLGYSSAAINDYFTGAELGNQRSRPKDGVPDEVVRALERLMDELPNEWLRVADAVMEAEPDTWKRWRKYRRRHKRDGEFDLAAGVRLRTGPTVQCHDDADVRAAALATFTTPE